LERVVEAEVAEPQTTKKAIPAALLSNSIEFERNGLLYLGSTIDTTTGACENA